MLTEHIYFRNKAGEYILFRTASYICIFGFGMHSIGYFFYNILLHTILAFAACLGRGVFIMAQGSSEMDTAEQEDSSPNMIVYRKVRNSSTIHNFCATVASKLDD